MSLATVPKRVLVTGGNKGIGKAICERLLKEHPDVHVLLGSRNSARGQEACDDLVTELGESVCKGRLEMLELDTCSEDSIQKAVEAVSKGGNLYGLVNNAGIGFGLSVKETINTNYFGPRRINDAFSKLITRPGGRIVNIGSAGGPNYVKNLPDGSLKEKLTNPFLLAGIEELDEIANSVKEDDGYRVSKALLNAYTVLHAQSESDLIINSVSPGWILTDLTQGMGASNPPSKGAVAPVWCLMSDDLTKVPTGRYYGSDCVRSPLHYYRGPGEPPYEPETEFEPTP